MIRLVLFLIFIVALATGLAWLADRPGQIIVNWEGQEAKISVFHAVVALALLTGLALVAWSLLRHVWESPAVIGGYFNKRRQKRGLDALSSGMIAIGAGDRATATKYAIQARKSMPNEPLTHLLRAQAAQLSGDKATARRIYESMLASTDTEQLGLRGLFLEAEREGEREAAKQFAERAIALNPQLSWPVDALFDLQCKSHDWAGALETLAVARKNGHVEKASAERRRAVLLTAQAQDLEDKDPERALNLALEAHKLAHGLVPAGAIAGRLLASRGATPKATKIVQQTWQKSPHPDLATAYAYARIGDSPRDRLDRVRKLAQLNPHSLESAIAVANAAIEAKDFAAARQALEPLMESRLTQRACTLMARIEGGEHGDKGRVREWLARAVNAPRDPAWTADGVVSEQWAAVSPVTGALDAFSWRVPVESMEKTADEIVARKLEELVALGAPLEVAVEAKD
ncbi:MAG: heme biosynthesis protein HemY, partial [Alphaproteobacteria bacterium BRH_c36]